MSAAEHLSTYAEGWSTGNADLILQAVTDDYTFDDPNSGVISKSGFKDYMDTMKAAVIEQCAGKLPEPFMHLTDVVIDEHDGNIKAWCWWEIPHTGIKGSGLIRVAPNGVYSEVITYYAKLGS